MNNKRIGTRTVEVEVYGNRRKTKEELREELELLGFKPTEIKTIFNRLFESNEGNGSQILINGNVGEGMGLTTLKAWCMLNGFGFEVVKVTDVVLNLQDKNWKEINPKFAKVRDERPEIDDFAKNIYELKSYLWNRED